MNEQQALNVIKNLADTAIKAGSVESLQTAVIVAQAIDKIQILINGSSNSGNSNANN